MRQLIAILACWVAALPADWGIDQLTGDSILSNIAALWVFVVVYVLLTGDNRPSSNDFLD